MWYNAISSNNIWVKSVQSTVDCIYVYANKNIAYIHFFWFAYMHMHMHTHFFSQYVICICKRSWYQTVCILAVCIFFCVNMNKNLPKFIKSQKFSQKLTYLTIFFAKNPPILNIVNNYPDSLWVYEFNFYHWKDPSGTFWYTDDQYLESDFIWNHFICSWFHVGMSVDLNQYGIPSMESFLCNW